MRLFLSIIGPIAPSILLLSVVNDMKFQHLILLLLASIQLPTFADNKASLLKLAALDPVDYHPDYPVIEKASLPSQEEPIEYPPGLLNMEDMVQDFLLETKQIKFLDYPGAFNPSIIRWRGSLLMSFRIYLPTGSTNPFALVWLDENFNPVSTPQLFELPYHNPVLPSKQQDPRLIAVNNRLFIVYNNQQEDVVHREMRRMFIVEMDFDGEKFIAKEPECLLDYEGKSEMRFEKNWVPFEYNGELMLAYSLFPHRIFRPLYGKSSCETVAISQGMIQWDWGTPRGGTQALLDGDHYLAFSIPGKMSPRSNPTAEKSPTM